MSLRLPLSILAGILLTAAPAHALELRLPAECSLGQDCFLQQFPDMKAGDGVVDPFCGVASYNDHDGVDLRVLSMKDIDRGVPVVAVADGQVLRGRDGIADRLVRTEEERAAILPQACGNGVVIAHADGVETQYCHLRRGSIAVEPGQNVKAGDRIGEVGASGLVQFPHVHLTVRVDGVETDPLTGRKVGEGCIADPADARPLFAPAIIAAIKPSEPTILGYGLSGDARDYDSLVVSGVPDTARPSDPARVAWAWIANLKPGDQLAIRLDDPAGNTITDTTTEALESSKAVYYHYAGKKGGPTQGSYAMEIEILRDGKPLLKAARKIDVK